jgi:hypothetical protein
MRLNYVPINAINVKEIDDEARARFKATWAQPGCCAYIDARTNATCTQSTLYNPFLAKMEPYCADHYALCCDKLSTKASAIRAAENIINNQTHGTGFLRQHKR